jgi:Rieske Fe-S protein
MDRRAFLAAGGALVLGGAAGCGGQTRPGRAVPDPDEWTAAGPVNGLRVDVWRERRVHIYRGHADKVYLRLDHTRQGGVAAVSARCPHLACPVDYVEQSRRFICPCHGAVLGFEGEPVGGPAKRPLDRFETRVFEDAVYVGRRIQAPGPGPHDADGR